MVNLSISNFSAAIYIAEIDELVFIKIELRIIVAINRHLSRNLSKLFHSSNRYNSVCVCIHLFKYICSNRYNSVCVFICLKLIFIVNQLLKLILMIQTLHTTGSEISVLTTVGSVRGVLHDSRTL